MERNLESLKKNADCIQSAVTSGGTTLEKMLLKMANSYSGFPKVFETIVGKLQMRALEH